MVVEVLKIKEKKQELKSFFNKNLNTAVYSIYQDDIENEEYINFKLQFLSQNIKKKYKDIQSLLKSNYDNTIFFEYYKNLLYILTEYNINEKGFQQELEKLNERTDIRKSNGVYYTPEDVSGYIIYNCLYQLICNKIGKKYLPQNIEFIIKSTRAIIKQNPQTYNFIRDLKILDSTCGTGAFLVKAFECKVNLLKQSGKKITSHDVCKIINSIHGNDIDRYSTYISKMRLLFKAIHACSAVDVNVIYDYLELNFYNLNFITSATEFTDEYLLIIGNPPYVEKSRVNYSSSVRYGNLYADVIHNSLNLLKEDGVIGYIIPISYISTSRMTTIRNFVENNTIKQYILSFADRPDCLFAGVHQKLNILIAQKSSKKEDHEIYTSDYMYWYKTERKKLFNKNKLILNRCKQDNFYPKLSNFVEENIYSKIHNKKVSIISKQIFEKENPLYLNKRAAFWIKSFIAAPYKNNEYLVLYYDKDYVHLVNCILNSSLYWWYWIKVSDCWHITNKELEQFYVPEITSYQAKKYKKLSIELNNLLETTKVKINSKQAMYEYKHRLCKSYIDNIDNELAKLYNLTQKELSYIKNYQLYYRSAGEIGEKE